MSLFICFNDNRQFNNDICINDNFTNKKMQYFNQLLFLTIYNQFSQNINDMSNQVLALLTNTLNPSLLQTTQREIERARSSKGFATELMLIANDENNDIKIRQSALVVLKNMVYDQCSRKGTINEEDYQIIKASILDFLARQWGIKSLTSTIRQIIHLIAQMDYPDRWTDIVKDCLGYIQTSNNEGYVASSVQALKAIASTCGEDQSSPIRISNFCNFTTIPLLELANKLFSNYNLDTQPILISIFKIFKLAVFYHLPPIIQNNLHSIMIFMKKIIDLNGVQIIPLKVICLKILSRIYSRHARQDTSLNLIKFAQDFHNHYSIPLVQSFILQLMDQNSTEQICKLSLNCLTCIYKNHEQSANLITTHHSKILHHCLLRYKMKKIQKGQSVGSYITHIEQQRSQLVDFIQVLFAADHKILGELIQFLNGSGDQTIQQLVLYIFSALGEQLEDYPGLYNSLSQFIVEYILPILSGDSSAIMKARGCQVICAYRYVQLPSQKLQTIFQFIYSCLTQSKSSYLNIYALQAFTQLICKYDQFMKLIIPYLQDILKVYTNLMKQSNGEIFDVIKSFEKFLANLNGADIEACAIDLVRFLVQLFYEYASENNDKNFSQNQDENSEENDQDSQEQNNTSSAKEGCLACIRQILATQNLSQNVYSVIINECILQLSVQILQDKNLVHFQECLNILNLCLYKSKQLPNNFDQFFKIFTYAILGIPNDLASMNLSSQYKEILANVCVNPDEDIVSNVIGFFKNFIGKANAKIRDFKDEIGISFMQYLFKIVDHVHNSQNEKGQYIYKRSERYTILTIYTSLVEYQFLHNNEFEIIVDNLMNWYSLVQNQPKSHTNIYIEMLLVCMFYNSDLTSSKLNIQWFIQELLDRCCFFTDQYQLQRLLIGVCKMMDKQMLKNQQSGYKIVKILPDLVAKLVSRRIKQEALDQNLGKQQDEIDLEQEAEQDFIGQNTHMGLLPTDNKDINKEKKTKELQKLLNVMEQIEWQEQFNKYYYSPFCSYNQLEYLGIVLKNSPYTSILSSQEQQKLTQFICNAPQKPFIN